MVGSSNNTTRVSKVEDSDNAASIKTAFRTVAGERDFITEEDLRRVMINSFNFNIF
jgi:hypothetical protein